MTDHFHTLYAATIDTTTYPIEPVGAKRWVAICGCGWHTERQQRPAAVRQLDKHLAEAERIAAEADEFAAMHHRRHEIASDPTSDAIGDAYEYMAEFARGAL